MTAAVPVVERLQGLLLAPLPLQATAPSTKLDQIEETGAEDGRDPGEPDPVPSTSLQVDPGDVGELQLGGVLVEGLGLDVVGEPPRPGRPAG